MIKQALLGTAIAASLAMPAKAQGWIGAITGLGAATQGYTNGQIQRYNMQRGYPVYPIQPYGYGAQTGDPSVFILNGRTVTCFPLGSGIVSCN